MITFDPLWKTMKKKGISQYKLINEYGISTGLLDRLRKNENVELATIDQLCHILDCNISNIVVYTKNIEK